MDITTLVPKTRSRGDKVLAPWETDQMRYGPWSVVSGIETRDPLRGSENEEISVRFWNGKEAKVSKGVTFWIPSSLYERTVRELPELQLWRRALCVQRCDEQLQLGRSALCVQQLQPRRSALRVQRCDEQLQLGRSALRVQRCDKQLQLGRSALRVQRCDEQLQLGRSALCVQRCEEQLQLGRSALCVQHCDEQLQLRRTALSRALASRTNQ
ncbi:UNVERIFIED_CONTAM: hypothetical protein FKN15_053152 [Acipenser sinensis]